MHYQWDSRKASSNFRKHGVRLADAVAVFSDDYAVTVEGDHPDEERFVTIGADAFGRVLVVVHVWRGEIHPGRLRA